MRKVLYRERRIMRNTPKALQSSQRVAPFTHIHGGYQEHFAAGDQVAEGLELAQHPSHLSPFKETYPRHLFLFQRGNTQPPPPQTTIENLL